MNRVFVIACWILLLLAHTAYARENNPLAAKKVLVLHSQHETFQWTDKLNNAIKEEFAAAPFGIQLYIEYMDARRFPAKELFSRLRKLYQAKYRSIRFDLILVTDNAAFDFLTAHRDELFPGVPAVFCGLNNYTPAMAAGYKNITGVLEDFDLEGTIELILAIQPEVTTIAMVSDASDTGRLHRRRFLEMKPLFERRVTLVDVAGLDERQVVEQLRTLPETSAVIVLSYHLDPHGKFFSVREGLEALQKGGRPLYSCWETSLGEGIVGGVITNARRHGRDAAGMGIAVLQGKRTADLPVQSCVNLPMFDYPLLERFRINQALLPNNSIIINKPDSFFIRYRTMILFVLSVFVVMSCLIVGLIIINIRRKQAQKQLMRERTLLAGITETSPVGITMANREGLVTFANRRAENMLGLTKDEITKRTYNAPQWRITDFDGAPFPEEKLPFRQVMASRQPVFDVRHAIEWPDGRRVRLSVSGAPLLNEAGDIESVVFSMEDVTGRSRAEQALRESEQKFREIFDSVLDGLYLLEVTGDGRFRTLEVNPALERSTGIPRSRVIGKTQEEAVAPDVAGLVNAKYRRCVEAGRPIEEEAVLELPAGARCYHSTLVPLRDERGRVHRIIGISRDITERKQAENELLRLNRVLRAGEERYRLLFENSPISIWEEDLSAVKTLLDGLKRDGVEDLQSYFELHPEFVRQCAEATRVIAVNRAVLSLHGAADKEELLASLVNTFTPESFEAFQKELVALWNGAAEMKIDTTVKTLAGEPRYVTVYFSVCPGCETTFSRILVSLVDITERKQAEEVHALSAALIDSLPGIFYVYDRELRLRRWNRNHETALGYTTEELARKRIADWHATPENRRAAEEAVRDVLRSGSVSIAFESTLLHKDGRQIPYLLTGARVQGAEGPLMVGVGIDITERKRSEESLALLNFALNNVRDEAYLITEQARFAYVNEYACRALGCTREELLGSIGVADVDPDFPAGRWSEHWRELRERGAITFEGRHRAKDGRIYPVEISANYFEYGGRGYNLALVRDITERKRIESALRASEQNLSLLVMQTPLGVIEWDLGFKVAKWNPAAERIFGYTRDEALGRHASLIVPPAARDHVDRIWHTLVKRKGGVRSTNENVAKDGRSIYCEWYNTPLVNDEGNVVAVASLVQDVTERNKAEEELRRLNEELEQRVRERTADLEMKNAELERMNRIFVGRELRMAELKKKVEELERKGV